MMIRLKCKSCGVGVNAKDEQAGKQLACPKCGAPIMVEPPVDPTLVNTEPFSSPVSPHHTPQLASAWFYQTMGEIFGPLSPAQLKAATDGGLVTQDTLVRKGTHGEWVAASHVRGLFGSSERDEQRDNDHPVIRPEPSQEMPVTSTQVMHSNEVAPPHGASVPRRSPRRRRLFLVVVSVACVALLLTGLMFAGLLNTFQKADPTEQFARFAEQVSSRLPSVLDNTEIVHPVAYDVRTTNSTVSPYTADITASYSQLGTKYVCEHGNVVLRFNSLLTYDLTVAYALQDNKWICKRVAITGNNMRYVSGKIMENVDNPPLERKLVNMCIDDFSGRQYLLLEDYDDITASTDPIVMLLRDCSVVEDYPTD